MEEPPQCSKSLKMLQLQFDEDEAQNLSLEECRVKISSVRRFKMVLGFTSMGVSLRSASQFVEVARKICKTSYFAGCSEGTCTTCARIICACSYQALLETLRDCWGYSFALDVYNAQGTSYLDLQAWFCTKHGKLANVHVIALLLPLNKTAGNQLSLCSKLLNKVDPTRLSKLVSTSTDEEHTMTGRVYGVQTSFEEAAEHPIVGVWFGLHQVDLLAQREYVAISDDKFVPTLTGLIACLRRQQNLQTVIKATCSEFFSTPRLWVKRVTKRLKMHRVRVTDYLNAKKPACTLTADWRVVVLCTDCVATVHHSTVTRLQRLSTLFF